MRGSLRKPLEVTFEKSLKQRLKNAVRVPMQPATPGSAAWLVGENENATAYIILFVHNKQDRFTIEVAYSRKKQIPQRNDLMPGAAGSTDESRFRLSRLWQSSGFEVWYDLEHEEDYPDLKEINPFPADEEPCLRRIPVKVGRALDALEAHGIPYLKQVVCLPA
jgi:hypothetical protein